MSGNTPFYRLLPLYIVIFIGYVGYSLMITVFTPLFIQGHTPLMGDTSTLTQRTIILGFLLALYPFGQFFGSPVLGSLSDRFGRKRVLVISLIISLICYILISYSIATHILKLLMLVTLLAGLAESNTALAQSAIADSAPPEERTRLFGYINLFAASAYVIGPLVGGKLADPTLSPLFSNAFPFACICGLLLATIILILLFFRETKIELEHDIHYFSAFTNLATIFTNKKFRILYLVNFLLYLSIFGYFRAYPMYLVDEFDMNVSMVSEYIAWVSVPIILTNLGIITYLARKFSPAQLTMGTAILVGCLTPMITISNNPQFLWLTLFVPTFVLSICMPASAALLSIAASQAEQGRVMGNNQALAVGAEALSGLIGGLLATILIKLPLTVLPLATILAAIILFFNLRSNSTAPT